MSFFPVGETGTRRRYCYEPSYGPKSGTAHVMNDALRKDGQRWNTCFSPPTKMLVICQECGIVKGIVQHQLNLGYVISGILRST
jgi:hypothetical protein